MNTAIFLNRLDQQQREKLFAMQAEPDEQALYIYNLYGSDAFQLAEDCRDIFLEMKDQESGDYWSQVYACMKALTIRH
ncbi:MAG: hypothetical protein HYS17_03270 [Micavibrio aeruginosavorus]|uniref:Uncharacterized protein n=1 Tax=Micavibrio aeruginosavorus TaxID=349221 RepID=A0A7T5R3K9_9BACT|nr:MAG: hypothetical protein HYS17_03270 [Micavibrio aeruginosavorus]